MADPVLAQLCPRWKAQLDFVYHPERLQVPLKREGIGRTGRFVPTSWDEALDIVADGLNRVKTQYGPESVVFWIAYTKEPRPYFHRLTHAFGSPNYLTESSSCFSAQWLAAVLTYGKEYGYWFQYSTPVNAATQCKLIWGSSIRQSRPPVYQQHLEAKAKGLKLIVVDPIRTHLASKADIHLQLRPGTDGALALGMINVILREGLFDRDFVEKWTVGFDELKKLAGEYTVHRAERITGVPAKTIEQAAVMYAMQKPAQIAMSANSTSHHYNGVQNHRAIIALPALTGNVAVKGGNCSPPRHLPLNDISLHERLSAMPPGVGAERFPLWTGLYREMEANMLAERMGSDKPYPIKALFGAGLNPMFFPNSNHFVERVKKLDFVVVTDYFQTPGTDLADVVLPISSWLERRILLTQPTGVTFIEPAIEPVGQTLPEWNIFSELAKRLGFGSEFWNGDQEACFDHMLKPLGITVADLLKQPDHTIKPAMNIRPERYYEEAGFETPSGKVELASSVLENHGHDALPVYKEPLESPLSRPDMLASFPLVMTTGARTLAYTHSLFRNIARLRELTPDPLVDIHPVDAEARGIKTGDPVKVTAPRGAVMMKAHVTDAILPGVVSAPHHWAGEANINVIMDDKDLDPISGFAPFKSSLCQVLKA
jgi:anaerobic selenocysteine-containing dehydrogenase